MSPMWCMAQGSYSWRWRHGQIIADHFWKHFIHQYLPSLQLRQKWRDMTTGIALTQVVKIVDNRAMWFDRVTKVSWTGRERPVCRSTVKEPLLNLPGSQCGCDTLRHQALMMTPLLNLTSSFVRSIFAAQIQGRLQKTSCYLLRSTLPSAPGWSCGQTDSTKH